MKLRIVQDPNALLHDWYRLERWEGDELTGRWCWIDSGPNLDMLRYRMRKVAEPPKPLTVIEEHDVTPEILNRWKLEQTRRELADCLSHERTTTGVDRRSWFEKDTTGFGGEGQGV